MNLFTHETVLERVQTNYMRAAARDEEWTLVMLSCPPTEMRGTVTVRCGPYRVLDLDVQAFAAASQRWETIAEHLRLREVGGRLARELNFMRVEDALAPGLEAAPSQLLSALLETRQAWESCVRDTLRTVAVPPVQPVIMRGYQQLTFEADTARPLTLDLMWRVNRQVP